LFVCTFAGALTVTRFRTRITNSKGYSYNFTYVASVVTAEKA